MQIFSRFCSLPFLSHLLIAYATTRIDVPALTLQAVSVTPILQPNPSTHTPISSSPTTESASHTQSLQATPVSVEQAIPIETPPKVIYTQHPIPLTPPSSQNLFLHPLSIVILLLTFLSILSTLSTLPFTLMPSDPRAAASSSSSSKDPKASSSSAANPSSSSRDARPSSSSSSSREGSSSSSSAPQPAKPSQSTPYISANAWMSFFLFCCLVLIILQGPLGLTGGSGGLPAFPAFQGFGAGMGVGGGMGGLPGCAGFVAQAVPWCQPVQPAPAAIIQPIPQAPVYVDAAAPPQMGGQGIVAGPNGGGGYSWYANPQPQPQPHQQYHQGYAQQPARPLNVQYQRPGLQVQMQNPNTGMLCAYFPYACQPLIPGAYAHPGPRLRVHQPELPPPVIPVAPVVPPISVPATGGGGLANLENAFYPLLVGAIALLVIFDYAS